MIIPSSSVTRALVHLSYTARVIFMGFSVAFVLNYRLNLLWP